MLNWSSYAGCYGEQVIDVRRGANLVASIRCLGRRRHEVRGANWFLGAGPAPGIFASRKAAKRWLREQFIAT